MKFRRLDEDTVCCIVSEMDMKEYGLELEDFFTNKEKSREFLMNLVEQAKEEVGYESKGGMLAMQLMPITKNTLAITFSENANQSFKNMFEHIKEATSMLEEDMNDTEIVNNIMNLEDDEKIKALDNFMKEQLNIEVDYQKNKKSKKPASKGNDKKQPSLRIYRFDSFHDIEQFCCSIELDKIITSRLFKDEKEGNYYLVINKGRLSAAVYNNLCENAIEFAEFISDNSIKLLYCEEHFNCLIKKKAVDVIRKIARGE